MDLPVLRTILFLRECTRPSAVVDYILYCLAQINEDDDDDDVDYDDDDDNNFSE